MDQSKSKHQPLTTHLYNFESLVAAIPEEEVATILANAEGIENIDHSLIQCEEKMKSSLNDLILMTSLGSKKAMYLLASYGKKIAESLEEFRTTSSQEKAPTKLSESNLEVLHSDWRKQLQTQFINLKHDLTLNTSMEFVGTWFHQSQFPVPFLPEVIDLDSANQHDYGETELISDYCDVLIRKKLDDVIATNLSEIVAESAAWPIAISGVPEIAKKQFDDYSDNVNIGASIQGVKRPHKRGAGRDFGRKSITTLHLKLFHTLDGVRRQGLQQALRLEYQDLDSKDIGLNKLPQFSEYSSAVDCQETVTSSGHCNGDKNKTLLFLVHDEGLDIPAPSKEELDAIELDEHHHNDWSFDKLGQLNKKLHKELGFESLKDATAHGQVWNRTNIWRRKASLLPEFNEVNFDIWLNAEMLLLDAWVFDFVGGVIDETTSEVTMHYQDINWGASIRSEATSTTMRAEKLISDLDLSNKIRSMIQSQLKEKLEKLLA